MKVKMGLFAMIFSVLGAEAGTTEFLLKNALNEVKNVNQEVPSCHKSKTDSDLDKILPYPTSLDEVISKVEEVESICSNPDKQYKAREETIKAITTLYLDYKDEMEQFGLSSQDYIKNELGEIIEKEGTNPLILGDFINEKEARRKLKEIKYYNGNEDEELKRKLNKAYSREENPILKEKSPRKRCHIAKLAYLDAVYRLTTLKPSFDFKPDDLDLLLLSTSPDYEEFKNYEKDKLRASWALKNFLTLGPEDLVDCKTLAGFDIYSEAMIRFDSINDPAIQKKPLGFALAMCGRSMTGHAFDFLEKERPQMNNCFSSVHRKALVDGNILNRKK